ncbi:MAG: ATP-dependent Clp protease proteolytic subunit [Proteobacteria bacterium]|nr:ATP-dependent Clp protease proteolytic subunit [Burkholderiales bacterium]
MGILFHLAQAARLVFWLLLIGGLVLAGLAVLATSSSREATERLRSSVIERFQAERKSRVIALIHRQESQSILGVQVSSSIDIEDSEAVLRAIRLTPAEQPIDMILHTPGGLVLAAEQIAMALADHKGKVTVFVPHFAMSGGTLIAMAAQEIVMDRNAVLGPVDPQIGGVAASSILKVVEIKKGLANDETLILADMAAKARVQVASFVADLLERRLPRKQAEQLAVVMSEGRWTHDFPITVASAKQLGFPVTTDMPRVVYELMDMYPQVRGQRPSVLYVPVRSPGPAPRDDGGMRSPAPLPAPSPSLPTPAPKVPVQ